MPVRSSRSEVSGTFKVLADLLRISHFALLTFCICVVVAPAATAQTQTFEAASVRLHPPADRARPNVAAVPASGRLTITATAVQNVILAAYGLHPSELVANGSPVLKQSVDIVATAGKPASTTDMQRMLQPLLADRFKLAVHRENREVDAYVVSRARTDRLGPKLIRSSADCGRLGETSSFAREEVTPGAHGQARCGIAPGGIGRIIANGMDMKGILGFVFTSPQRAIVDQTRLDGRYDIDVTYTPEAFSTASLTQRGATAPEGVDPSGPSLFTALQDQLGLKVEERKATISAVVIDRIEALIPD